MEKNITKELLEDILKEEIKKVGILHNDNMLLYADYHSLGFKDINIYELNNKIVDWIEQKGFWIRTVSWKQYELVDLRMGIEVYECSTDKRINSSTMCAEWIFKNIKEL